MIVEINEFVGRGRLETDVCIIGGGTAGITLARELIGQPFRVCLLESGGAQPDPVTNALGMGANIGLPYYPLDTARARFYGKSSTRWHVAMGGDQVGARMRPFDPIDFERRDRRPTVGGRSMPCTSGHITTGRRPSAGSCPKPLTLLTGRIVGKGPACR